MKVLELVTLLPLFNGEDDDMVKKISKNITELNRKGSSAPAPGARPRDKPDKESLGLTEV